MSARKRIVIVQPNDAQRRFLLIPIRNAAATLNADVEPVFVGGFANLALEATYRQVDTADLIVVDATDATPAAMYVLGYAHARENPVLIIYESADRLPFDVRGVPSLYYNLNVQDKLINDFRDLAREALDSPSLFRQKLRRGSPGTNVFISYSHKDQQYAERLRIHLRPLVRDEKINLWDDRRIEAGQDWRKEIATALKKSQAAVLLISADFLASDFIYKNELPPILQKAQEESTVVLPLIVSPCRYDEYTELSRFQAVNDPARTMAEMTPVEQERLFDKLRQLIESFGPAHDAAASAGRHA
jgi:TIR domain